MTSTTLEQPTRTQSFVVAPSDLTFLLHECRRCFWFKVVRGQRRPPGLMPGVFSRMDRAQREYFDGRSTRDVSLALPEGSLSCHGLDVLSCPIEIPGTTSRI